MELQQIKTYCAPLCDRMSYRMYKKYEQFLINLREADSLISLLPGSDLGSLRKRDIFELICNEMSNNLNWKLVEINLSDNNFKYECLKTLGESLKNNTTLTSLILDENFYFMTEDEFDYFETNRIGYDGLKCIIDSLCSNTTLTNLSLKLNGLSLDEIRLISEFLKKNKTLLELNLSSNLLDSSRDYYGFEDQYGIHNEHNGFYYLVEGLKHNTTLTSLNLSQCSIYGKENCFQLLFDELKTNSSLTKIDLSKNKLTSKNIAQLCDVLKVNTHLNELNLSELGGLLSKLSIYNDPSLNKLLCDVLKTNISLTKLILKDAPSSCYPSVIINALNLSEVLKVNTTLAYLDLSNTYIKKEGLKVICDALTTNTTLTYLNISDRSMNTEENVNIINEMLKQNTTLTKLDIEPVYNFQR